MAIFIIKTFKNLFNKDRNIVFRYLNMILLGHSKGIMRNLIGRMIILS